MLWTICLSKETREGFELNEQKGEKAVRCSDRPLSPLLFYLNWDENNEMALQNCSVGGAVVFR